MAIGAVLIAMVYAGGHISGAHFNPAVTMAMFIRGKATIHELIGYIVLQVVAASTAALIVLWLKGGAPLAPGHRGRADHGGRVPVHLRARVRGLERRDRPRGQQLVLRGAIGLVIAGAYAVGPISGGAFNPAVSVGTMVMGGIGGVDVVVYLIATGARGRDGRGGVQHVRHGGRAGRQSRGAGGLAPHHRFDPVARQRSSSSRGSARCAAPSRPCGCAGRAGRRRRPARGRGAASSSCPPRRWARRQIHGLDRTLGQPLHAPGEAEPL